MFAYMQSAVFSASKNSKVATLAGAVAGRVRLYCLAASMYICMYAHASHYSSICMHS